MNSKVAKKMVWDFLHLFQSLTDLLRFQFSKKSGFIETAIVWVEEK
jgi:hypothetical protein